MRCRYSYRANLTTCLSCAILAAELVPAVFGCDILHPQRRVDYAAYVPVELFPGINVFDDSYRSAVVSGSLGTLQPVIR